MIATKSNSDIRYNNLYFLGDSLSDSGAFIGVAREFNIFNIFKSQEFEAPLYKDFCSNGPTYSQILANKLGIKLVPAWRFKFLKQIYEKIGNNYAVAGAQITKLPFWKLKSIFCNNFSLPKQAKTLLKHHQLTENDLVIINIGGNELINAVNISDINESKATINNAINIQKATIINLINNNARKIIVANAPDISKTPSFLNSYNMDKAKNLSEYFNSVWLEGMKQLQTKYPQIIKLFDLNVVFNKNLDEFQKKGGITNKGSTDVNYSCILFGLNVKPEFNEDCDFYNINDYFFFDFIHPTSWVHEQLGDIIYDLSQSKW
ncbi:SGNH/GDSL hydrolase family protein [Spiroplasma endosymbiont of Dilophus febrilis]|uniref:SGNH/GDSL hydrolase family protein n=1 Tax=Spiroplasma endosymbiont of Dilophus febrilis TaxID=3066292 RepID=UPI00313B2BE1